MDHYLLMMFIKLELKVIYSFIFIVKILITSNINEFLGLNYV